RDAAHGPLSGLFRRAVAEFLAESRAFADRLDAATRDCLQDASSLLTTRELIGIISSKVGGWPASANMLLVFPLLGHLGRRRRSGFVTAGGQNGFRGGRWREGAWPWGEVWFVYPWSTGVRQGEGAVKQRALGRPGRAVPPIGLGGFPFGGVNRAA